VFFTFRAKFAGVFADKIEAKQKCLPENEHPPGSGHIKYGIIRLKKMQNAACPKGQVTYLTDL